MPSLRGSPLSPCKSGIRSTTASCSFISDLYAIDVFVDGPRAVRVARCARATVQRS